MHRRHENTLQGYYKTECTALQFIFVVLILLSTPELKVWVSFSDRPSSVVCLSVYLFVRLSVNFLCVRLLLKNHWANFNQTWHIASLRKGGSSLFKWRATSFSKGRLRKSENTSTKFENLLLENYWANFNQTESILCEGDAKFNK